MKMFLKRMIYHSKMDFIRRLGQIIKSILPNPFTIAILLTILTFLLGFFLSDTYEDGGNFFNTLKYWEEGLWDKGKFM